MRLSFEDSEGILRGPAPSGQAMFSRPAISIRRARHDQVRWGSAIVAKPSTSMKPHMSVTVVRIGPEARAGSM